MNDVTISNIMNSATVQLACAGVEDPIVNIRVLVGHALGLKPNEVASQADRVLTKEEADLIGSLIDRRAQRETLNRIIGKSEFCGLWFKTNEATLEPRTDGEILVRAVLKKVKPLFWRFRKRKPLRILDLGTGSGCIILSFLHALPYATGLGIDIAPRAIEQARENADHLGLSDRCEFRLNNWHTGIEEKFDIISFNPPYIPSADIPKCMSAVRDYDPILALDGGEDGLDPYRIVIPALPKLLKKGGYSGIELGDGQASDVAHLLKEANFEQIDLSYDLRGFERIFVVQQKN